MKRTLDKVLTPVQEFIRTESASGVVLGISAILAIIIANSPAQSFYEHVLHTNVRIGVGSFEISEGISHWINDFLMAIFFLLVGLEIKREIKYGELADRKSAALPIVAAAGGALVPAAIFFAFARGTEFEPGWAIPMATDIAFALGVLALLGNRVPPWAKVFLMASAVVDDLIAVLVIAVFYTADLNITALVWGAAFLVVLALLNASGVRAIGPYLAIGILLWVAFLKSGVHATIAGVLLGFMIPAFCRSDVADGSGAAELKELIDPPVDGEDKEQIQARLTAVEDRVEEYSSPLHRLEHDLHPLVAFGIMPIFAFANAGVAIEVSALGAAMSSPLTWGIAAGLFVGKQIGIIAAWLILAKIGASSVALSRENFRTMHGLSLLAGIGFTMSLFVGGLAFGEGPAYEQAKIAILGTSLVAGVCGYMLLARAARKSAATA